MGRNNFTAFIYGKQSGRCIGSRKPRKQRVRNAKKLEEYDFEEKRKRP